MTGLGPAAVRCDDLTVPGGPSGEVPVRILRPRDAGEPLPAVLYTHCTAGDFDGPTLFARLVGDLLTDFDLAVVFPGGGGRPEPYCPTAIEECYAVAAWVCERGGEHGLDGTRLALVGDSVGANLVTVVAVLAHERGGPGITAQVLFRPATDVTFVSPLRATLTQPTGLPPALVITAVRSEETATAIDQAASFLRHALGAQKSSASGAPRAVGRGMIQQMAIAATTRMTADE